MKQTIKIDDIEIQIEAWRSEVRKLRKSPTTLAMGLQFSEAALMASVYELCADQLEAMVKKARTRST